MLPPPDSSNRNEWTVFKGGSAFNSYITEFQRQFPNSAFIIPITDDGGSSREIGRVFGGPAIGDLRATLTRLSDESTCEACAVKKLLEHRLHKDDAEKAAVEWCALLENRHPLYLPITSKYKNFIRAFLCKFEAERLHRIDRRFDLRNGSIGNFFFTGARMFLGSLETAIFMYSSVAQISPLTHVIPIIDSNDRLGIGVRLENQQTLIGQTMISHPCSSPGNFDKKSMELLPAPIAELFYVDPFNHRIYPDPHLEVIRHIQESRGLIYGVGSLWTSIAPSLILKGVGEAIAALITPKIVLLNCCQDRETAGMTALDYIQQLTRCLNRFGELSHPPKVYLTDLFTVKGSEFSVDEEEIRSLGICVHRISAEVKEHDHGARKGYPVYSTEALLNSIHQVAATHEVN